MACAEIRSGFSDYLDDALDADARRRVTEHLASCADCRRELDELKRSLKALHDTGPIEARKSFETTVVASASRSFSIACVGRDQSYSEAYDRTLPGPERAEFDDHLLACEGCREDYRVFTEGLATLAAAGPVSAPLGFEKAARPAISRPIAAPAPARSRWLVPVAASAAVVSLALGVYVKGAMDESHVASLNREIRKLKDAKPPPPPDNTVRVDGKTIPLADYLDHQFAMAGLVRQGPGWIPFALKEHLDRGEVEIGGKWVKLEDEVKRRAEELAAAHPSVTPSPAATEAEVLAKLDLVAFENTWMPREYVDRLKEGKILAKDGSWQDRDDLATALLADRKLVQHEGRWMTTEQRAEMLAAKRVVVDSAARHSAVARAMDGLEITAPTSIRNLTIYGLAAPKSEDSTVALLPEAIAEGEAEIADTGTVLSVRVTHKGTRPLLVLGGDLLPGGRSTRMVARDVLVPRKGTVEVPVYDVEPAGWRTDEKFAGDAATMMATVDLRRRAVASRGGQGAVWVETTRLIQAIAPKAASPVQAGKAAAWDELEPAIETERRGDREIVGYVIAVNDEIRWVELFAGRALCRAATPRLWRSASIEAELPDTTSSPWPNSPQGAKQFLESLLTLPQADGDGAVELGTAEHPSGWGCVAEGRLVHLAAFADRLPAPPEARGGLKVPKGKSAELLKECEARLKSGSSSERAAGLNELAGLPLPEVTGALLSRLGDGDLLTRTNVIQAIGRRRDPAAVPPLLKMLEDSRRDVVLLAPICGALAKIGDARAIEPMTKILETKDADAVRTVASALPELLLQVRDRSALEKAVARLVDAVERAGLGSDLPSAPPGTAELTTSGALQSALRTIVGREFPNSSEARLWWNREESRRKFLDERTR